MRGSHSNSHHRPDKRNVRDERTALIVIVAVWLISALLWFSPGITRPDGVGYYMYLPSLSLDRDLLFFNEWDRFGLIDNGLILHKEVTSTDHLGNHWTVGSAILWSPAFALAHLVRVVPSLQRFAADGVSLPFNAAAGSTSALAGLLTLLIGFRVARASAPAFPAGLAAVAVWFGTPLLFYSVRNPILSHAPSALACALVLWVAIRLRGDARMVSWFVAGLASGFAFIVRPQNATFALIPFMLAWSAGRPLWQKGAIFAGGFFVASLPQLIVSFFLYGNPFGFLTGGGAARPFAAFERIWIWEPVLSWYHGLIPWSPIAAVAIAGLGLLWRSDRRLAAAGLYALSTQWFVNAALERSFWGAYSFGQRRFDNCTVFFVIGAAALFTHCPRWAQIAIAAIASLWTMSIFLAALGPLDLGAYYTPSELLGQQTAALAGATSRMDYLESVPPEMKPLVTFLLVFFLLIAVLIAVIVRKVATAGMPLAATVLSMIFVAASGVLYAAGITGRSRAVHLRPLIEFNRTVSDALGGADARMGLLADEARYLRKSGRIAEAERTESELRALEQAREQGFERLRAMGVAR